MKENVQMNMQILGQLDMLFHDIKNGNLENGSWIKHIEEIKNSCRNAPELCDIQSVIITMYTKIISHMLNLYN